MNDILLQNPEHVIEGNVVQINRAGPRPDYDKAAVQQVGACLVKSLQVST